MKFWLFTIFLSMAGLRVAYAQINVIPMEVLRLRGNTHMGHPLRTSVDGVTVAVTKHDSSNSTLIAILRTDTVEVVSLNDIKVHQAVILGSTMYLALDALNSTSSVASLKIGSLELHYFTVAGNFPPVQTIAISAVNGEISAYDVRSGPIRVDTGVKQLRKVMSNWNQDFYDKYEVFSILDTTYLIGTGWYFAIVNGDTILRSQSMGRPGSSANITIIDDSVQWVDMRGTLYSHSISSGAVRQQHSFLLDNQFIIACMGRYGALTWHASSNGSDSLRFSYVRTQRDTVIKFAFPQCANFNVCRDVSMGWWAGDFFLTIVVDDSITVLYRLNEPSPSTSVASSPSEMPFSGNTRGFVVHVGDVELFLRQLSNEVIITDINGRDCETDVACNGIYFVRETTRRFVLVVIP